MKNKVIVLAAAVCVLSNCGMYNRQVRDSYADKLLAYPANLDNIEKVKNSTFKNFLRLKISRECDFDLFHFCSYSYHYRGQYSSTDVDIYSTLLSPTELFITLANVFDDHFSKKADGSYCIKAYSLTNDETLLTKDYICEIRLRMKELVPGAYDKTSVEILIKNNKGDVFFDSNRSDATVTLSILSVSGNILNATLNGKCKNDLNEGMNIHTGEFWVKLAG